MRAYEYEIVGYGGTSSEFTDVRMWDFQLLVVGYELRLRVVCVSREFTVERVGLQIELCLQYD